MYCKVTLQKSHSSSSFPSCQLTLL